MVRPAEPKRRRVRAAAAAGFAAAALAAWPASAEPGSRLQPGGYMTRAYGLLGPAEGRPRLPHAFGQIEFGAGLDAAYPVPFAPAPVGLSLGSGWLGEFMLTQGAAGPASGAAPLANEPARSAAPSAISYFTPRLSGLQIGATYAPPAPDIPVRAAAPSQAGQNSASRSDFALGVTYLESFQGIDVTLTGGYRTLSVPNAAALDLDISDQDTELGRYTIGTSIEVSGLTLGGVYAREVGDGPVSVHSWDAGVSYATGPWTLGVGYLRSAFVDTRADSTAGYDELETVQAGLAYSVGPGIVASFNVLHSSLEDRVGKATTGMIGILGFSYNF